MRAHTRCLASPTLPGWPARARLPHRRRSLVRPAASVRALVNPAEWGTQGNMRVRSRLPLGGLIGDLRLWDPSYARQRTDAQIRFLTITYLDCTDNHKSRIKYCHAQEYGENNLYCKFAQRDDYHIPVGIYSKKCNDCQNCQYLKIKGVTISWTH